LAEKYLVKAVSLDKTFATPLYNLGLIRLKKKHSQESIEYFKNAIHLDSTYLAAYKRLAEAYSLGGRAQEAIETHRTCIQRNPKNTVAYNQFAWFWSNDQKNYVEALIWYKKSIKIRPNYPFTLNNIGYMFEKLGNLDSALYYSERSVMLDPTYGYGYSTIAEVYGLRKDVENFYLNLELALKNRYPLTIENEEPYKSYSQEVRYQELKSKYLKNKAEED
jgi:tetratricopeptide (TPR) repeat protein